MEFINIQKYKAPLYNISVDYAKHEKGLFPRSS